MSLASAASKACENPACGCTFVRGKHEASDRWRARRFCSRECYLDTLRGVPQIRPETCTCGECPRCKQRAYSTAHRERVRKDPEWSRKVARQTMDCANRRRVEYRARVAQIKRERGCMYCEECEPVCLDFHHRDPEHKTARIADAVSQRWAWLRILAEIAKCDVLCANCHRKVEAGLIGDDVMAEVA